MIGSETKAADTRQHDELMSREAQDTVHSTELWPPHREWQREASRASREAQELRSEGCLGVSPMKG